MGIESVSIVFELERRFGIRFPDRIARASRTVRDLEEQVLALRRAQLAPAAVAASPDADVRRAVREVVARELNLDMALITPEADLVADLGVDA